MREIQLLQLVFRQLKDPYTEAAKKSPFYVQPSTNLEYLVETYRATSEYVELFTENLKWEFAGLANPMGIKVGAGTFASAHEVILGASRVARDCLSHLLVDDKTIARLTGAQAKAPARLQPLGQLATDFDNHWDIDNYDHYVELLWAMMETLRHVEVRRLDAILDCEFAIARRGRGISHKDPGFPRTHLTPTLQRSPLTGNVSYSPSSRPAVVSLLQAIEHLRKSRSSKEQLSLTGVYNHAKLTGETQQRAKKAAVDLGLIDESLRILPPGDELLEEGT